MSGGVPQPPLRVPAYSLSDGLDMNNLSQVF